MATAYTLAANATLRDIGNAAIWGVTTARTGSDTISTNGFNFTHDQDSRYGLGGNTSAVWGSLTILATKGGNLNFDGRYIRMIPFTSGSGTITAGALITCGSATGYVIGIYSGATMAAAVVTAPVLTATTGYIKVTAWNSVSFPTSGTYTQAGFTFTITGPDVVGFMEVNGVESSTINANRLGQVNITGAWFSLGKTDGTSTATFQLPTHGLLRHSAGVFVEKTAGQKDYEFYPNAGTATTIGTEASRGKVCWITNAGVCRIGNNGSNTMGYTPPAGLEVVVGNIWFENVSSSTLTANVIPNATITTRYSFNTTGGGVINIDKCDMAWYLACSQAYSVNISNSGFIDSILLSEIASPMTLTTMGVGDKPTTALLVTSLTLSYCYAGGTFTDCVWTRVSMASSGAYTVTLSDIDGFTFIRNTIRSNTVRANSSTYAVYATRVQNTTWTSPLVIEGAFNLTTCNNINITDTQYIEAVSSTTATTYTGYVFSLSNNTINCLFSGLTFPVTNTQPYTALLIASTGCSNIKMRNIGTRVAPLNLGSANACGLIYTVATNCSDFKFQRIYVANTRTGIMSGENSCTRFTEENVFGDYADATDVMALLNQRRKGMGGIGAYTAQLAVYGTHWSDSFTSTTAGRINLFMNEPTALSSAYISLTGGAGFTSAGGLYMPVIGQSATFEMDYYALGHTRINNTTPVMGGGTIGNYVFDYAIDLHDGAGFSQMTTNNYTAANLATALNGITTIDASKGFKLRLKITTGTTNTTAITYLYLTTISTATAQDYQYPLDTVQVKTTVVDASTSSPIQGAHVYIVAAAGGSLGAGTVILDGYTDANGISLNPSFELSGANQPITGKVRKSSSSPYYKTSLIAGNITSAGFDTTLFMILDE